MVTLVDSPVPIPFRLEKSGREMAWPQKANPNLWVNQRSGQLLSGDLLFKGAVQCGVRGAKHLTFTHLHFSILYTFWVRGAIFCAKCGVRSAELDEPLHPPNLYTFTQKNALLLHHRPYNRLAAGL